MNNSLSIKGNNKSKKVRDTVVALIRAERLRQGDKIIAETQIAKLCGVNPLTAHRSLAKMAKEGLLYRVRGKGTFVGSLVQEKKTPKICLVLPGTQLDQLEVNPDCWHVVQSVLTAIGSLKPAGIMVATVICPPQESSFDMEKELSANDAVFFIGSHPLEKLIQKLTDAGKIPVVVVGDRARGISCMCVDGDLVENARMGVCHLADHGYRRIGFIGSDAEAGLVKYAGYQMALREYGMALNLRRAVMGINSQRDGRAGASLLLEQGADCDAVFVDTDLKAVGVIELFREKGMQVPDDIAVMGHDGLETYVSGPPYLATVKVPYREIIQYAVDEILRLPVQRTLNKKLTMIGEVLPGRTCGCTKKIQENTMKTRI